VKKHYSFICIFETFAKQFLNVCITLLKSTILKIFEKRPFCWTSKSDEVKSNAGSSQRLAGHADNAKALRTQRNY